MHILLTATMHNHYHAIYYIFAPILNLVALSGATMQKTENIGKNRKSDQVLQLVGGCKWSQKVVTFFKVKEIGHT